VTCDADFRIKVITALNEAGLLLKDIKTIEPSLEEAFVKIISNEGGAS